MSLKSICLAGLAVGASLLALPAAAAADVEWPGLPPDCWSEARVFHAGTDGEIWEKNTRITQIHADKPKPGELSPNRGYYFVRHGDWPTARIVIYAEKDALTQIEFANLSGLGKVAWVTEKLLHIRVWWGRATGNDLLFDVETRTVIYAEQFWDGTNARRQFVDNCPKAGCTCIGADKARSGTPSQ